MQLVGETRGLRPVQRKNLERLYRRRFERDEIVSRDVARELLAASEETRRRIALLVDRDGDVLEVVVGTRELIMLPDLGRYRLSSGRLRRIRLLFTDVSTKHSEAIIPRDIYTDLIKLRLDAVVSLKQGRNTIACSLAHLNPDLPSEAITHELTDIGQLPVDFRHTLDEIEAKLGMRQPVRDGKLRAMLVGVYGKGEDDEISMTELRELARTAELTVAAEMRQRRTPDPKTLLGKGKLEEVVLEALKEDVSMLVFDTELKPSQWRSITNMTELKVIDRSMLILDIFAKRASSSEGRLQVELAQLKYNLPKLVEKDAGLSRLSGGIGGRGPGETKLEIGRRRIRDRISFLDNKLKELTVQRRLRSERREEGGAPLVSLVGYTNVGKSTLFNALTKSSVIVENKLFATLEPSKRRVVMPFSGGELTPVIFADTVGFIRNLPEELFNAFRATNDEVQNAKVLIHVLDASDPNRKRHYESVRKVMEELQAGHIPEVVVLNKVDAITEHEAREISESFGGALLVSAEKRLGFKPLLDRVSEILFQEEREAITTSVVDESFLE